MNPQLCTAQNRQRCSYCSENDELADVLTAISIVSRRLARKIAHIDSQTKKNEGGTHDDTRQSQFACK